METLLNTVLENISFPIPVIRKYVDDLFLLIPADKIDETLEAFNSYHPKIQFTVESENNGRLPYLDMTVVRQQDHSIRTEWFIKEIASGRQLNYLSMHPLRQKINLIHNFIDRVNKLSTNLTTDDKKSIIKKHLQLNSYPQHLINRCLNRTIWITNDHPTGTTTNTTSTSATTSITATAITTDATTAINEDGAPTTNRENTTYRSLPYIPTLTNRIVQLLRTDIPDVLITTRSTNTIRNLHSRLKDALPPMDQNNVIYQIPCRDCDRCYIGMTSNLLKKRLSGHKSNVNKLDQLLRTDLTYADEEITSLGDQTALIKHCVDYEHRFTIDNTKILDHTYKKAALPILEMIHIFNNSNTVNRRTDVQNLSNTYTGILHAIQQNRTSTRSTRLQTNNPFPTPTVSVENT